MTDQKKPSISLVLIARDEVQNVAELLNELSPLFDEAIVVDTGSTDDTAARATVAGARVVNFQWCDDFAAARNHGIDTAGGDWILTVDADERIAPGDFAAIRNAVRIDKPVGYFFTQRNYTDLSSYPEWQAANGLYPDQEKQMNGFVEAHQIRLFPNLPELRYHGCIHETVGGFEKAVLEKEYLEVTVHHYGHLRTGDVAERRNDLYTRLTREKFRQNPDDCDAIFQMATRHLEEGHTEPAMPLLEQLVAQNHTKHPAITRGNLTLGRILKNSGNPEAAIEKFELAVQQKPEWLICWTEVLSALVDAGRWSEVSRYLNGAGMLFPDEPLLWKFECRLLIATGQYDAAEEKARKLVDQYPGWAGAQKLAGLCRKLIDTNL